MIRDPVKRRNFLRSIGGVVLLFALPRVAFAAVPAPAARGSLKKYPRLDAWLRIGPDGTVTVFTGKVEIGQGILTAIAQIAADELDVDLARVRVTSGDTAQCPDEGWTAGSLSIEDSGAAVRHAAADARRLLLELAAPRLAVAIDSLRVTDGTIDAGGRDHVTYWTLAAEHPLQRVVAASASPKPRNARRLIGTSVPRIDLPGKFSGARSFLQDVRLPAMLHGRVVRPPSPGARLLDFDEAAVRAMAGVRAVVRDGSFLGVVATREEQAIAARAALAAAARWTEDAGWPLRSSSLTSDLRALPQRSISLSDVPAAVSTPVVKRLSAEYSRPFVAHASIGPSAAIASIDATGWTVWTHSQAVFPLRRALAKALATDIERMHVVHVPGAGCYGNNGQDDVALDAALLARATPGEPVRVQWMRDDEFAWEPFGSAMAMRVDCGLAADGTIADWKYDFWTGGHAERADIPAGEVNLLAAAHLAVPRPRPAEAFEVPLAVGGGGSRNAVPYYVFPARVTEHLVAQMPIRTSSLRALGAYPNIFAIESMMDEAAAATAADPIQFRIRHLNDPRAVRVLQAVASAAKWHRTRAPRAGQGRGVAFSRYKNAKAYVAIVVELHVERATGRVRLEHVFAAVDAGEVINPDGLRNQIEGGIIQGLSWTLKEAVTFDERSITTRSWSDYPILTFSEVPEIDVTLVETPGEEPFGAGEPSVPPVGAAVANAITAAIGVRPRDLPFTPERLRALLPRNDA
jgi:CO/xanthine dehydrogenase Mo-binding subunit